MRESVGRRKAPSAAGLVNRARDTQRVSSQCPGRASVRGASSTQEQKPTLPAAHWPEGGAFKQDGGAPGHVLDKTCSAPQSSLSPVHNTQQGTSYLKVRTLESWSRHLGPSCVMSQVRRLSREVPQEQLEPGSDRGLCGPTPPHSLEMPPGRQR